MSSNPRATVTELERGADALTLALLDPTLVDEVRRLVARLDSAQRLWLSGYLAGSVEQAVPAEPRASELTHPDITVLYGSQSGNSERLAKQLAEKLAQRGLGFALLDMMDCRKAHLQQAGTLLVIVSTHGDGDPPDRAAPLYELLHSRKAPQLGHLKFAVLALGDSSYEKFCETGRQFDARLEALGAERWQARADCDVDFETPAHHWMGAVLDKLADASPDARSRQPVVVSRGAAPSVSNAYTRKNPFIAPVLANQSLTARQSTKDVRHIELSLEGSNIRYEPGDSIGVVPRNHSAEADALLEALCFGPEVPVVVDSSTMTLRQALIERFEIGLVSQAFLERYARAVGAEVLVELLSAQREDMLRQYMRGRHVIDLVREHPRTKLDAAAFAGILRPLAQRLYSIASSAASTPEEVHLTVSLVEYESLGRRRRGVVSGFLADLRSEDAAIPVYLYRNPSFRLPRDPETPIIMIGPGTGVAPFRAFMAEREAAGAPGRNWLFFGDRSFESDFLYQAEWLNWRKRRLLTRIDVAFSRDQPERLYVQHRMQERGEELWAWLQDGAHLYVCGDAAHMAPDVHRTLLGIVQRHGGYSEDHASDYLTELQRTRRYQKDVY